MEFSIESDTSSIQASDADIEALLDLVYVQAGYTSRDLAQTMFAATAVRNRGQLIIARDAQRRQLVGMIILVPPTSAASHSKEAELHLLAVDPGFRGHGLGRQLVNTSLAMAQKAGFDKIILRTQTTMTIAHNLYESFGFKQIGTVMRDTTEFKVYERHL